MVIIQVWDVYRNDWVDVTTVTKSDGELFMEQSNRLQNRYRLKEVD